MFCGFFAMTVAAYVLINVRVGKMGEILDKLRGIRNVKSISVVAGEFDLIVRVEVDNLSDLFDVTEEIHKIDGIEKTITYVVEREISSE